jgi:tRNA-Thr(GGU) m(6)t(6)A37 methyltransferase TsaA
MTENDKYKEQYLLKTIARIHTAFPEKFGIPRQSGIIDALKGIIVFEPKYRDPNALRGLEGFSHIWLIWGFSKSIREEWAPMVKPPRLGGNKRMGVFATRSPFRPNPIGLSSVKLESVELHPDLGPVLHVTGADLMDGTPIYDIKPYLSFTDSHPEATGGFADPVKDYSLEVVFPEQLRNLIPVEHHEALMKVLAHDPRPSYQNDPDRKYGFGFAGFNIRFTVNDNLLTVFEVTAI